MPDLGGLTCGENPRPSWPPNSPFLLSIAHLLVSRVRFYGFAPRRQPKPNSRTRFPRCCDFFTTVGVTGDRHRGGSPAPRYPGAVAPSHTFVQHLVVAFDLGHDGLWFDHPRRRGRQRHRSAARQRPCKAGRHNRPQTVPCVLMGEKGPPPRVGQAAGLGGYLVHGIPPPPADEGVTPSAARRDTAGRDGEGQV